MKSQRRHELQTNYLADHLGTAVETSKPYAMWVSLAIAAVVVVAIGYGIYASQTAKAASQAWGEYYFNIGTSDPEVLQQIAEDHPGTAASNWALQAWADNQLLVGLDQIYNDRKQAEETIQGAIEAYQGILKSTYEPELKTRAAIGLAQAYESLGKLDDASRYYQQVIGTSQDGFAGMAAQRLAWIKSGEGKSFYDWFASVRSTPAAPPAFPSDLSKPPQTPDISFPQKQNPLTLPGAEPTPPTPQSEAAPGDAAPAATPPATAKPEAGTPADAQPADAKPADAEPADAKPAEAKSDAASAGQENGGENPAPAAPQPPKDDQ